MRKSIPLALAVLLGLAGPAARAQDIAAEAAAKERPAAIAAVETRHRVDLPDGPLAYRAIVETLPAAGRGAEPTGEVAVIAYLLDGAEAAARPVTFVFNGGPGASSAYLHLGGLGPRAVVGAVASPLPPSPPRLADNPDTWLAFTDLVFIDPVGAGFSRAHEPGSEEEKAFWSVSGDVRSLADVIRRWLADHGRWASPKVVVGESYGGFRAIQIAHSLLQEHGIAFDGLVLISAAIEFDLIFPSRHAVLPHALALPSLIAAARAHGRGNGAMPMAEVERFALEGYLAGISAIAPAGAGPDAALTAEVAGLLGLDPRIVRRFRARLPADVFAEQLLEGTGLALSVYDGAFAGPDARPGRGGGPDPLLDALTAPLSTAYNAYVREELGVETDLPFRLLNRRPSREWDWEGTRGGGSGDGALDELAETLALTPGLGVLIVHGRTDLVTPYMASAWLIDQLDLPDEVRARVSLSVLDGGHMMYLEPGERAALALLAARFYARRTPGGAT